MSTSAALHDAALSRYIEHTRSAPVLSREVEHDLALAARSGDDAALRRLIEANLRYAVAIAVQYRRYGTRLSDLISEANLGLVVAARKFDPDRGTRFVTYAGYWIRAFVLDFIVRASSMVGAGSGALRSKVFFRLRRERAKLANLVPEISEQERLLAERFGVTVERIREMSQRVSQHDYSLETPLHDHESLTMRDTLVATEPMPDDSVADRELDARLVEAVNDALDVLDRRERFIVEHRLMADTDLSLAAIGRKLGVSRERARQLEARAKQKLRSELKRTYQERIAA